jgi:hypothetical protein
MSVPSLKSWPTEMIRLRIVALAALACAIVPVCVHAAESNPEADLNYNLMGPSTCARWPKTAAITSAAKATPLNWALGFLSGSAKASNMARLEFIDP